MSYKLFADQNHLFSTTVSVHRNGAPLAKVELANVFFWRFSTSFTLARTTYTLMNDNLSSRRLITLDKVDETEFSVQRNALFGFSYTVNLKGEKFTFRRINFFRIRTTYVLLADKAGHDTMQVGKIECKPWWILGKLGATSEFPESFPEYAALTLLSLLLEMGID